MADRRYGPCRLEVLPEDDPGRWAEVASLLGPEMREADVRECRRLYDQSPEEAILMSIERSHVAWYATLDGRPAAVWGLTILSALTGTATPWLLTGNAIEAHKRIFWWMSGWYFNRMAEEWPVLVNFIDVGHARALRWASALGFEMGPEQPYGPLGNLARPIVRRHAYV